jgi:predicted transcriptional regulator
LTQQGLAELAGTRQETISRIEGGAYTASHKLIDRIERALQAALKKVRKQGPKKPA